MEFKKINEYIYVEIIDYFPKYRKFGLKVDEVIGVSGFITISKKDLEEKIEKYIKENKLEERVNEMNKESIRRGHASVSTSPHIAISIKASRISDLFFTSYPFGSYLVMSQRFVESFYALIPNKINEKEEEIFRKVYFNQYKTYKKFLEDYKIKREIARRVLGLGFNSHMFLVYPIESINHIRKLVEINYPYIPEEINLILKIIEKRIYREEEINKVFENNFFAPHYNNRFPNIFYRYNGKVKIFDKFYEDIEIIGEFLDERGILEEFLRNLDVIFKNLPNNWRDYRKYSMKLGYISSLYPNEYVVRLIFPCSLACFNELKRHRTLYIIPESIYDVIDRLNKEIEKRIYYPKVILEKESLYKEYRDSIIDSYSNIEKLIEEGLSYKDIIYLLPQAIQINSIVEINLQNLISPFLFYRLRSCFFAEEEIREKVRKIPFILRNKSKYKEYTEKLFKAMVKEFNGKLYPISKCVAGICPERNYCESIFSIRRDYNKNFHDKINKEF